MKRQLKQRDAENLVGQEILKATDDGDSLALTLSNGSIVVVKKGYDLGPNYDRFPVAAVELNGQVIWTD
jgi:hypothetical protein